MKSKSKKVLAIFLVLAMVLAMTGCMTETATYKVNSDGTVNATIKDYYEKTFWDQKLVEYGGESGTVDPNSEEMGDYELIKEITEQPVENVDGIDYYVVTMTDKFKTTAAFKTELGYDSAKSSTFATTSGVRFVINKNTHGTLSSICDEYEAAGIDASELNDKVLLTIKITMPKTIKKVSKLGKISGKTATFKITYKDAQKDCDIMVSTASEKTAPTISGVTSGKTYKTKATVKCYDLSGIKTAQYKIGSGSYKSFLTTASSKKFTKKGKYTVKVTDYYGNVKTVTFTIK